MSRWITSGLQRGVRTTKFPLTVRAGEEGAPSRVLMRWRELTPAMALAAGRRCPTAALEASGTESSGCLRFDAGACVLCGRCTREFPAAFEVEADPRVGVLSRDGLRLELHWENGGVPAPVPLRTAASSLDREARRLFRHSLHIRHLDAGSCNGCESELQMLGAPYLDLQRLGLFFTPTPRHADVLLVTGVLTSNMRQAVLDTYAAMPSPKLVIAAGACAVSCGSFASSPAVEGPLDLMLPVDAYIPGCPPTPQALLHGLLLAVGRAREHLADQSEVGDGA